MGVESRYGEKGGPEMQTATRVSRGCWFRWWLAPFCWRGTVHDAPYRQFKRVILTCQKRKTLVTFATWSVLLGALLANQAPMLVASVAHQATPAI
jgi:hypothetical protein